MSQLTKNNQDLLEILIAVAWIDGEIQPEEKKFIERIASEQNISLTTELQTLFANYKDSSLEQCYQLLNQYLGTNPNLEDYEHLLTAVSKLIYSDNDIATAEASILTQLQNLDPRNLKSNSAFDQAIHKIRQLYRAGIDRNK
ncbi:MAG: TerB family tellurite resistance protein [Cyanobacteria bacterium P01_A01_bin.83]